MNINFLCFYLFGILDVVEELHRVAFRFVSCYCFCSKSSTVYYVHCSNYAVWLHIAAYANHQWVLQELSQDILSFSSAAFTSSMNLWDNGGLRNSFLLNSNRKLSLPVTLHALIILYLFNFRKTLGNSLYCLPHRTGKFTSDVVWTYNSNLQYNTMQCKFTILYFTCYVSVLQAQVFQKLFLLWNGHH